MVNVDLDRVQIIGLSDTKRIATVVEMPGATFNFDLDVSLFAFAFFLVFQILSNVSVQNAILLSHIERQSAILKVATSTNSVRGRKPRRPNRKRSRRNFRYLLQSDGVFFRENFKISRAAFIAIVTSIKASGFYVRTATGSVRGMHKQRIRCTMALALTLLYLSEKCSLRAVANMAGISKSTCHKHIHKVLIILAFHIFPRVVKAPTTEAEFNAIALDFQNRSYLSFIMGAIDGTHIPILRPSVDSTDYMNRKGFFSMVFQGVAIGSMPQFIEWSEGWAGSVGDSVMFKQSELYKKIISGVVGQYRLLADAAYGLHTWCLVPFERVGNMAVNRYRFNFW